jgi:hypothetical protein
MRAVKDFEQMVAVETTKLATLPGSRNQFEALISGAAFGT